MQEHGEHKELNAEDEIRSLRASNVAMRTAIDALMICLPYAQQRFVLQHLEAEAKELQEGFGDSSAPQVRQGAAEWADAMRSLARHLEGVHLATMQEQWAEAASPKSVALRGQ